MTHVPTVLDDLEWRGLLAHSTDPDALRAALSEGPVRFYFGFDPTAPSLHLGNLVQILTARRLQDAGHTPYALVGGATGMIGDPKESGERTLNTLDTVKDWVERVRRQIEPFLEFEGPNAATMVNNYDWTASLSTIDFLRDIGKHFPVNRMLAVSSRPPGALWVACMAALAGPLATTSAGAAHETSATVIVSGRRSRLSRRSTRGRGHPRPARGPSRTRRRRPRRGPRTLRRRAPSFRSGP